MKPVCLDVKSFQSTYANIEAANTSFTNAVNTTYRIPTVPKVRLVCYQFRSHTAYFHYLFLNLQHAKCILFISSFFCGNVAEQPRSSRPNVVYVYPESFVFCQERVTKLVARVNRGFEDAVQTMMHLNALVECTNLHKEFVDGIDGICHRGL